MSVDGYLGYAPPEAFKDLFEQAAKHKAVFESSRFIRCDDCQTYKSLNSIWDYLVEASPRTILALEQRIKLLEAVISEYKKAMPDLLSDALYLKDGVLCEWKPASIDIHELAKAIGAKVKEPEEGPDDAE